MAKYIFMITTLLAAFSFARTDTIEAFNCNKILNSTLFVLPSLRNCQESNKQQVQISLLKINRFQKVSISTCNHKTTEIVRPIENQNTQPISENSRWNPILPEDCKVFSKYFPKLTNVNNTMLNTLETNENQLKYTGNNVFVDWYKQSHYNVTMDARHTKTFNSIDVTFDLFKNEFQSQGKFNCKNENYSCMIDGTTYVWNQEQLQPDCNKLILTTTINAVKESNSFSNSSFYSTLDLDQNFAFSMKPNGINICGKFLRMLDDDTLLMEEPIKENTQTTAAATTKDHNHIKAFKKAVKATQTSQQSHELTKLNNAMEYQKCVNENELLHKLKQQLLTQNMIETSKNGEFLRLKGEYLNLISCEKFMANLDSTSKCFKAIPIVEGNQRLFISPITRIVQTHAASIHCGERDSYPFMVNGTTQIIAGGKWENTSRNLGDIDTSLILREKPLSDIKAFRNEVLPYKSSMHGLMSEASETMEYIFTKLNYIIVIIGGYAGFVFLVAMIGTFIYKQFQKE